MISKALCDRCGWQMENADPDLEECPECGAAYSGTHTIKYLNFGV